MSKKPSKSQLTLAQAPVTLEFSGMNVLIKDNDAWLTQKQIAELFQVDLRTINYHIKALQDSGEIKDSVIQEIRITASDGKSYNTTHYGLDVVIPIGYRVGSSVASAFRAACNDALKQYFLIGYAINEKRMGSKSLLKMEDDLSKLERHELTGRPEYQRLSRVYENKHGAELLWAIVADVCMNPDYSIIKGTEYKLLFGFMAKELKALLGSDDIRASLPDRQLQAFTLAETTLRDILSKQQNLTNEQVLEAVRIAFVPIATYLRGVSELMGEHHVTGKPLLSSGKAN